MYKRQIIQTGDVDVMIAIRSNFVYTRTVPGELWHFDKGKPAERRDTVLMLDARTVYRKVTRKIYDFSPEQLANLTAIVWLYRDFWPWCGTISPPSAKKPLPFPVNWNASRPPLRRYKISLPSSWSG